jgi:ABC-2 type transport system permease protein
MGRDRGAGAGDPIAALISGLMTAGILAATWKISPRRG